jgi:phosphatidylglycerophosphate synthase
VADQTLGAAARSAPPRAPARPALLERYRLAFNRRGHDWWSIVFAYPIARFLVALAEPVAWITPTAVTLAGFACKLAAAAWIWTGAPGQPVAAAVLLNGAQVLDAMDGTLARARKTASRAGAFLDKVSDAVGFGALAIAIGHRAAVITGDPLLASLGGVAAAGFAVVCYMHRLVRAATGPAVEAAALAGGGAALSWPEIAREWACGWTRVLRFQEADLYFWMSLLVALSWWRACVHLLAAVVTFGVAYLGLRHWRDLRGGRGG